MKLTLYSQNIIMRTFQTWHVPKDFADPMYNYLVYGFGPGSCFTAVLANDFVGAIRRSHPANTIEAFKALAGWICDTMPLESHGSYEAVSRWLERTADERRAILEERNLIYTAKEELFMVIKEPNPVEVGLY
jgi:hypothetical protein